MGHEHLVYIPRPAKIFITILALLIFSISIGIVAYSLLYKADIGIVSTALTLAQTCAAGLSIIALIFFTKFSVSLEDLRDRTSRFLVVEIPQALQIVEHDEGDFEPIDKLYKPAATLSKVKMLIRHRKGGHDCQYQLHAYGKVQRIYVQTNVKRMVVSYYLNAESVEDPIIRERLDYVISAAETAGYTAEYKKVHDTADKTVTVQLRLFRSLPDEFLMSPSERLYIANDLASMTRALVRALPEEVEMRPDLAPGAAKNTKTTSKTDPKTIDSSPGA
jgi:hypothetical protein